MHWRCLLLFAAVIPSLHAADWIKVSSPNFTLYTTHAEDDARRTLQTFEQTRDFFHQVNAFAVTSQLPFTLVDFGSESEYRAFTPGPFVRAWFTGNDDDDYIVMSDVEGEARRVAVHEYVHSVVRHSGLQLPLWLNEGLAEVYSQMQTRDGVVRLGEIPADRVETLRSLHWMRLPALIAINQKSPDFNEADRSGLYYAQSCLLAHMLMLGDGYAAKFSTFLQTISASGSEQTAFSQVYGKSLIEVERDLQNYFDSPAMGKADFHTETHRTAASPAAPATDIEIGMALAQILAATGRPAAGLARLHVLAINHEDNLDVAEAAAFLEWRIGEVNAAMEHFQSILSHPEAGWKAWWDYAQVLDARGSNRVAEIAALRKVVGARPDMTRARLRLGALLLSAGEPSEALAELKQIKEVAPRNAGSMYLAMASAALAAGQPAEAKQYAESAGKSPLKPEEQRLLRQLVSSLENPVSPPAATQRPSELDDDPGRPILRRKKLSPSK